MQRRAKTSLKVGSVKPCFLLPWKHCSMHIQWVNTFFSPDSLQGNQVEPVQKLVSQETSAAFQCKLTPFPLFTFYSLPSSLFSPLSPLSLSSLLSLLLSSLLSSLLSICHFLYFLLLSLPLIRIFRAIKSYHTRPCFGPRGAGIIVQLDTL